MNDTTWFWKIVDARGLADVSSDEFVALNELISKAERAEAAEARATAAEAERDRAREALSFYSVRESYVARTGMDSPISRDHFGARAALSTAKEQTDV